MKVTRVILAATDNPLYWQFWNPISRIYKENFGIQPTLIYLGKESDVERLGLSEEFGNIIVQAPHPNFHIGWQATWAIFWFMIKYPDDTFCTMGIDQVPLSKLLISDAVAFAPEDSYLMLASDAYKPSHWKNDGGTSPTSFHFVNGSLASQIYGFEMDFYSEICKLANSNIIPYYDKGESKWGLDESYSSHKLRKFKFCGGNVISSDMFSTICDRRIECCRDTEVHYDEDKLKQGWYGDAHFCRPFSDHKSYIEKILNLIPKI